MKIKINSYDGKRILEFLPCPFCGKHPKLRYIGNSYTNSRAIEVYCSGCRIKRRDGAIRYGFEWLEDVIQKTWNQRPGDKTVCLLV